jgi:DNA-binding transcriptional LysR family regulator
LPEGHPLTEKTVLEWTDLAGEALLVQQRGAGPEMKRLPAIKLDPLGMQRFLHQGVSIDRLMGLVGAGFGICLILEGATGARYDGVAYREVHDQDGPKRFNFAAYWRETNNNPTLRPFLDFLRERYPDPSCRSAPESASEPKAISRQFLACTRAEPIRSSQAWAARW